jgi:predicted kinase
MHLIEEALREGRSVVVDNTNPTIHDRAPIIALARDLGATVTGYFFESRVDDCLVRNRGREGKQRVPDAAIHITRKRLQEPTPEEGFDRLFRVSLTSDGGFSVKDWSEEQGET